MTPHDFFIQNIWWMLQEILKGVLLRPEKGEFTLQETAENTPDLATQRKLLRVLRGYRAITLIKRNACLLRQTFRVCGGTWIRTKVFRFGDENSTTELCPQLIQSPSANSEFPIGNQKFGVGNCVRKCLLTPSTAVSLLWLRLRQTA